MKKAPAFQLYARDFLADPLVDAMEPEELGGYFRLLLISWELPDRGYLPNDDAQLAAWSRLGKRWKKHGPAILRCFRIAEDGRFYQKRMVAVADDQAAYREKQRQKGLRSAAARATAAQPDVNRGSTAVQPEGQPQSQPETNPPPASPPKTKSLAPEKPARGRPKKPSEPLPFTLDEGLDALASGGRFVATPLQQGPAINAQTLIRKFGIGKWRLAGEWLAAGGEGYRDAIDSRSLTDLPAWIAHAEIWQAAGRPRIGKQNGPREPAVREYPDMGALFNRIEGGT